MYSLKQPTCILFPLTDVVTGQGGYCSVPPDFGGQKFPSPQLCGLAET